VRAFVCIEPPAAPPLTGDGNPCLRPVILPRSNPALLPGRGVTSVDDASEVTLRADDWALPVALWWEAMARVDVNGFFANQNRPQQKCCRHAVAPFERRPKSIPHGTSARSMSPRTRARHLFCRRPIYLCQCQCARETPGGMFHVSSQFPANSTDLCVWMGCVFLWMAG
jgi:hypothetical protein